MKRNCLTSEQKNKFINLTLIPELLADDYVCLLPVEDRINLLEARELIMKVLERSLYTMTKDLLLRLRKEMRNVRFVINRIGEPTKSERIVNSWDLETVLEHSMVCCVNCNKNYKNCRLNEAFKKMAIPVPDPEQKGCKYRIDKE